MNRLLFAHPAPLLISIAALCLAGSAGSAQAPAAAAAQSSRPGQSGQAGQPNGDLDWLKKTGKLYYSSARAGLTGFDCAVHPDWRMLAASANEGAITADDEQRIALLKTVKITLHARMHGGSTIEWVADSDPDKPLDQSSTDLLDSMHRSVQRTLEGFLQFWGPFMEASVVPDTTEGLDISHTATEHRIHAKEGDTDLTEIFSPDLVLQHFDVEMKGVSIKFDPTYKPTPQGLLVNGFEAHILPAGAAPEQVQVMKVGVEYQFINGLTIPEKLKMEVTGTGNFNFVFDGCTTNPK